MANHLLAYLLIRQRQPFLVEFNRRPADWQTVAEVAIAQFLTGWVFVEQGWQFEDR